MSIRATLLIFLVAAAPCAADSHVKQLFNGEDLEGWKHVGQGEFVVEGGTLKTVGGMGLLYYAGEPIENAVLQVVYKPERGSSNSGIFIRIPEKPQDAWYPVHKGYEVQIHDETDEFHRTGSIYSLAGADEFPPSRDGWNTLEITLDGQTTVITVNGKEVNRFEGSQEVPERKIWYEPQRGPRPDRGYIGIQNHDEDSTVWIKEVSVKPLG